MAEACETCGGYGVIRRAPSLSKALLGFELFPSHGKMRDEWARCYTCHGTGRKDHEAESD